MKATKLLVIRAVNQHPVHEARDEYYQHFVDELEDDFTLVELMMERCRERARHPRHHLPPLPSMAFLREELGLWHLRRMTEFQEPVGMNAIHCAAN